MSDYSELVEVLIFWASDKEFPKNYFMPEVKTKLAIAAETITTLQRQLAEANARIITAPQEAEPEHTCSFDGSGGDAEIEMCPRCNFNQAKYEAGAGVPLQPSYNDLLWLSKKLEKERDQLKQQLSTTHDERREEWQPIETAPKDGTYILAYEPEIGVHKASYRYLGQYDYGFRIFGSHGFNPTHWQPLPQSPTSGEQK